MFFTGLVTGVRSLCSTFIASLPEDNPIIIPSLDVRTELLDCVKAFGENRAQTQTLY